VQVRSSPALARIDSKILARFSVRRCSFEIVGFADEPSTSSPYRATGGCMALASARPLYDFRRPLRIAPSWAALDRTCYAFIGRICGLWNLVNFMDGLAIWMDRCGVVPITVAMIVLGSLV